MLPNQPLDPMPHPGAGGPAPGPAAVPTGRPPMPHGAAAPVTDPAPSPEKTAAAPAAAAPEEDKNKGAGFWPIAARALQSRGVLVMVAGLALMAVAWPVGLALLLGGAARVAQKAGSAYLNTKQQGAKPATDATAEKEKSTKEAERGPEGGAKEAALPPGATPGPQGRMETPIPGGMAHGAAGGGLGADPGAAPAAAGGVPHYRDVLAAHAQRAAASAGAVAGAPGAPVVPPPAHRHPMPYM